MTKEQEQEIKKARNFQVAFVNKMLLQASKLLEGTETVYGVLKALNLSIAGVSTKSIPMPKNVPDNSPVLDALRLTALDVKQDKKLFAKGAYEKMTQFKHLVNEIIELSRYHPTPELQAFVVHFMHSEITIIEDVFKKSAKEEQISFTLPE